jgi:hypothetical protein
MERSGIRENSGFTPDSDLTVCIRATGNLSGNYVTLNRTPRHHGERSKAISSFVRISTLTMIASVLFALQRQSVCRIFNEP